MLSERQLGIDGGDPDKYYVCRVYNGTIRYGVLFTRSIGDADAHANLGLLATPEMRPGKLTPNDRFFVLASDGVWDFLGEEDVARLVEDAGDDAQSAVLNVVQTCVPPPCMRVCYFSAAALMLLWWCASRRVVA